MNTSDYRIYKYGIWWVVEKQTASNYWLYAGIFLFKFSAIKFINKEKQKRIYEYF